MHLFEVREPHKFTYQGLVQLVGEPYREVQDDIDGNPRLVWIFSLRRISGEGPTPVTGEWIEKQAEKARGVARRIGDSELEAKATAAKSEAGTRSVISTQRIRNEFVSMYAKQRANGNCQLCDCPAPFSDRDGEAFLETHHIIWLSKGGKDIIENTVALCPNCHRKMHILNERNDLDRLRRQVTVP